ncbi:CGNR zinc finger domain-containing protein [Embleya sp. NPDC008237]|uniref:CGNR zinc finger domain-containing protein n=1 Tax=Embleya sp. NPDC008237 TaxID=3363978 RepID=UPI0036E4E31C
MKTGHAPTPSSAHRSGRRFCAGIPRAGSPRSDLSRPGSLGRGASPRQARLIPDEDCGRLFADPGGRRRWCSLATCGNRCRDQSFSRVTPHGRAVRPVRRRGARNCAAVYSARGWRGKPCGVR